MRRRDFFKTATGLYLTSRFAGRRWIVAAPLPSGVLEPAGLQKFTMPLVIPPEMPKVGDLPVRGGKTVAYYEIAVRQFQQQILPTGKTTVWSYGSARHPDSFFYPAFTIEATYNKPVRVKWINDLKANGNYLPHLLPVDQTLHWANPPGPPDRHGHSQLPYLGPVPIVTHVHGAHTHEEFDGYPEAWYLPAAGNLGSYVRTGTWYERFKAKAEARLGQSWEPGTAVFEYPNDQRATTLWYHDHTLGMTRLNVYAGPAGFYLLRGGPDDRGGNILPGPAPALGDKPGTRYYEVPIAIQDRSFYHDGQLFYPANRAFFESLDPADLRIPFAPMAACGGASDVAPIWNPEFFGNVMVVNGRAWPYMEVERRRYRFRFLNGCNSRFLILQLSQPLPFWQIGAEGGFLPRPVRSYQLLMAPAERADVILDFSQVAPGTVLTLRNLGPDEPFGGGTPGEDFEVADPNTTGRVMEFRVAGSTQNDISHEPVKLGSVLPPVKALTNARKVRRLSLNEEDSATVKVREADGSVVLDCATGEAFGPVAALLGTMADGNAVPKLWMDAVTENPVQGELEIWELYNFTADAHPIHVHQVQFQVLNRQALATDGEGMALSPAQLAGPPMPPEPAETGFKDTVTAYPGQVTRILLRFDLLGRFVWHCHIVEHEDNEMMRPLEVI